MSSDEEENVKLYSALERNQKRKILVSISSSESDGDDDDAASSCGSHSSPMRKRSRRSIGSDNSASKDDGIVILDDEEEEDEDGFTASERAQERQRERDLEAEIQLRLAQDKVLNQTRAIMSKITTVKKQMAADGTMRDIISLDSEDDDADDDVQILPQPVSQTSTASSGSENRGERIALQVRSNGTQIDEVIMFSREPFSLLYERFCDLHGLPRSAVQMSLDGEALQLNGTPLSQDLESGDLIDAKVDFSKADEQKKKQLVRLRLIVEGKRPEVFKIDVNSTLDKLLASFCKKHQIADPDDVEMTHRDERLRLDETVAAHDLIDNEVINVVINNYVNPDAIELNLRYDDKTSKLHLVVPSHKVEVLISQAAEYLSVPTSRICLRLDGEGMEPSQTFAYYDLEGGELIEVRLQP